MTDISISNLKKAFHGKVVLDIPQFTASKSEIISVLGVNGAGKSTFIKTISGLLLQDEGQVNICGYSNFSPKIHQVTKFVLESGKGYYDYLTANQNIDYFLKLNKASRSDLALNIAVLFQKLDFQQHADTLVSELSQGTRQKLSLIIALLCRPEVLCLDEPTNGLDVIAKKQLAQILLGLSKGKNTIVLLTTHDISFARDISSRVLVMDNGRIKKDDSFEHVFSRKNTWKKYEIVLPLSFQNIIERSFQNLHYVIQDEEMIIQTQEKDVKDRLLKETDIVRFEEIEQDIEEILYEVLSK